MATSGGTGEIINVDVTIDRAILATHTVRIPTPEGLQLHDVSGNRVGQLSLSFNDTNWNTPQVVKVSGSIPGQYQLECFVSSAYFQKLGVLKEEQSDIQIIIVPEQPGWNGSKPGVAGFSGGYQLVRGNLFFKYEHTGGTQTISFRRTQGAGYGDFKFIWCDGPSGVLQADPTTMGFSASDRRGTITMTTAGTYRFHMYHTFLVSTGAIPDCVWYAKLGNTAAVGSGPYLSGITPTTKCAGIQHKPTQTAPGSPNAQFTPLSGSMDFLLDTEMFGGADISPGATGGIDTYPYTPYAGWNGSTTRTGLFKFSWSGQKYLPAATMSASFGPRFLVGGTPVNSPSTAVILSVTDA